MYNIAIIGLGNIGARHLQSLAGIKKKLNIFVITRSHDALLKINKKYFSKNQAGLIHCSSVEKIKENLDLAIIATNSDIRYNITERLIRKVKIKAIIFEKVLFQTIKEYHDIIPLLKKKRSRHG
jgi:predicted dehydrogenase